MTTPVPGWAGFSWWIRRNPVLVSQSAPQFKLRPLQGPAAQPRTAASSALRTAMSPSGRVANKTSSVEMMWSWAGIQEQSDEHSGVLLTAHTPWQDSLCLRGAQGARPQRSGRGWAQTNPSTRSCFPSAESTNGSRGRMVWLQETERTPTALSHTLINRTSKNLARPQWSTCLPTQIAEKPPPQRSSLHLYAGQLRYGGWRNSAAC